jgi:hypothetical protein
MTDVELIIDVKDLESIPQFLFFMKAGQRLVWFQSTHR